MNTKLKGIKIDVATKSVYEVEVEPGLHGLYEQIGCSLVGRVELDNQNDLWYDDEGLLTEPIPPAFRLRLWQGRIVGNALIMGYTDEGDTVSTNRTVADFINQVQFLN